MSDDKSYHSASDAVCFHGDHVKTLADAIDAWGEESQWQIAIGECGEFVSLAGRREQGRMAQDDAVDECADVFIMMQQVAMMLGTQEVQKRVEQKIERLQSIIDADTPYPHKPGV